MAAIDLIQRNLRLTVRLNAILKQTNHTWVVGHDHILAAIKRHAPDEAERAMLDHINSLISDIHTYRDRIVLAAAPAIGERHEVVVGQTTERRR
jgi:DNA-binding FadR family transcriptional regulator